MKNTIKVNKKKIKAFKEKMEEAGLKIKAKYSKKLKVLAQQNRDLLKKLEAYKDGEQSKWKEFKTNFKRDMDGVGKTMKGLFKYRG